MKVIFGEKGIVTKGTLGTVVGESDKENYTIVKLSSGTTIEAHKDWYTEYKGN